MSQKQQLILTLEKTYLKATSENDFYQKLKKEKLEIYARNVKPTGVMLNRKYRFSTLGFTKSKLQKLELNFTLSQREQELRKIQMQKEEREKGINR